MASTGFLKAVLHISVPSHTLYSTSITEIPKGLLGWFKEIKRSHLQCPRTTIIFLDFHRPHIIYEQRASLEKVWGCLHHTEGRPEPQLSLAIGEGRKWSGWVQSCHLYLCGAWGNYFIWGSWTKLYLWYLPALSQWFCPSPISLLLSHMNWVGNPLPRGKK